MYIKKTKQVKKLIHDSMFWLVKNETKIYNALEIIVCPTYKIRSNNCLKNTNFTFLLPTRESGR